MLMRFDPFRELDRLAQQTLSQTRMPTFMPMDAYRRGDSFVVVFDLPGYDMSSINLTTEKNVLTVEAERRWQPAEGEEVVASERPQGRVSRQLFLGDSLDVDKISAEYRDGLLTVTIPVSEQAKPRRIEVGHADSRQPVEAGVVGA